MTKKCCSLCAAATAMCLTGLLAMATAAMALPTRQVKAPPALTSHSSSTTSKSGQLAATARCGAREHVVSGGFKATTTVPPGALVASHAVGRTGWTVSMYPYFPERLTAYAYCARNGQLGVSKRRAMATAAQAPTTTTATASCPSDEVILSGGFAFQHASLSEFNSSTYQDYSPDIRHWTVTSAFATVPARLATFAYCGRGLRVVARSSTVPSPSHTKASATASCLTGETLLSGGFTTDPTPDWNNTTGPDTYFAASYRSAVRSWTVADDNYSDAPGTLTAFAYCAK